MTTEEAIARLLSWCMGQVGTSEGANNWNKYAENPDLQRMYGWKAQNQPWCDVFVDAGFIACFGLADACAMTYQPMGAGSALCRQSAQYYKDNGAWSTRPEIGDQVFFFASGAINHTGIVVRVVGGSVITVEGNSNDQVSERCYSVGDSRIAGYGRPRWELAAEIGEDGEPESRPHDDHSAEDGKMDEPPAESYVLRLPVLKMSAHGPAVCAIQGALIANKISCGPYGADGNFGPRTETAVVQFQEARGLHTDGIIGPQTAAALLGGVIYTETTGGKDNGCT